MKHITGAITTNRMMGAMILKRAINICMTKERRGIPLMRQPPLYELISN